MCEVLIIGKYSPKFKTHLSNKDQKDDINEFKKFVKSFNGTYIIRRGVVMSHEYDGVTIIKFDKETCCDKFMQAMEQSEFLSACKIFKLSTVAEMEQKFLDISKVIKVQSA